MTDGTERGATGSAGPPPDGRGSSHPAASAGKPGFGDLVERALSAVGITSAALESWLGKPCGCAARKEKLNALGFWARRVLAGKISKAREYLDKITAAGE